MKTRAQTTKRQNEQKAKFPGTHSITLSLLPLNPPSSTPSTPSLLVRCHRSSQPRRVKEGKALIGERTTIAHTRPRRASGRCGIEAMGLVSKRGEGGVIEFLIKDEWWWIDVMAGNPTARHRMGASAVESQRSYSYSIRIASARSIHTAHTVPSNTALLIPLPPHRHRKVPPQQNGERPTPGVVEACSMKTGRLCLGGTDTVEWGKGKGGRAGGGWLGWGFG